VELHCHLMGCVRPGTVAELVRRHDVALPVDPSTLFRGIHSPPYWGDAYRHTAVPLPDPSTLDPPTGPTWGLLDATALIMAAVRDRDDFARIAYEALVDGERTSALAYREMSFELTGFLERGVPYTTIVDGLIAGCCAAEQEVGVGWGLIAAIDRGVAPATASAAVREVVEHPRPEVLGIGLEGAEPSGPPEAFAAAYELAAAHGLHRTAHAGEHVPSAHNVMASLDVLGCDRIDHGYFLLEDPIAVERCAAEGTVFTCACTTSRRSWIPWRTASITRMAAAGLRVTVCSDDPAMFPTDLAQEWCTLAAQPGIGWDRLRRANLDALDAAWMDGDRRARLRAELQSASDALVAELGL
jgi:adenosine deaminase